jgi:hypothetical protein
LVAVFVSVSIAPSVVARAPRPHEEVPGDGEGVGGYRDAEPSSGKGADEPPAVPPWVEAPNMHYVDFCIVNWYWFSVFITRI